jgi:hypothetical protein
MWGRVKFSLAQARNTGFNSYLYAGKLLMFEEIEADKGQTGTAGYQTMIDPYVF